VPLLLVLLLVLLLLLLLLLVLPLLLLLLLPVAQFVVTLSLSLVVVGLPATRGQGGEQTINNQITHAVGQQSRSGAHLQIIGAAYCNLQLNCACGRNATGHLAAVHHYRRRHVATVVRDGGVLAF